MTQDILIEAITNIDADIVEEYVTMREEYESRKRSIPWTKYAATVAASFFIVLGAAALYVTELVFSGANFDFHDDPSLMPGYEAYYASVTEVENVIGGDYLFYDFIGDASVPDSIRLAYSLFGEDVIPDDLHIERVYEYDGSTDTVTLDVYFNAQKNTDYLYRDRPSGDYRVIPGELTENGVNVRTVSFKAGGLSYGRAQFDHNGCTYVLSVTADGDAEPLEFYLSDLLRNADRIPHDCERDHAAVPPQVIALMLVSFAFGVAAVLPMKRLRGQLTVTAVIATIFILTLIGTYVPTPSFLSGDGYAITRDISASAASLSLFTLAGAVITTAVRQTSALIKTKKPNR